YPRAPSRLRSVHVAGAATRSRRAHVTGQIMGSERRLIEPLLLGCGLVSRSGLCGGGPLSPAARARPVLLSVVPLLALRRRARRGLLPLLDRDDTETVSRRLRPLLLLTVLVGVGAGLLRASDSDDRALYECGVLGVATEQGHAVERDSR